MAIMGNRNAARAADHAYGADGRPGDRAASLRGRTGRLVLAPDPGHRTRHLAPASTDGQNSARESEILSRLLGPFAGEQAPELAESLLTRFDGLAGLFCGRDGDLAEAVGHRPEILHQLRLLEDLVGETLRGRAERQALFPTPESVIDFVRFDMLGRRRETLRIFFLDSDNHLLSDDIMAEGSVASLTFHPREIIRRALEVDASAMIMVHNHPCASPQPSSEDIRATRTTAALAAQMDIRLHDHLVVARRGWCSMRADGHV